MKDWGDQSVDFTDTLRGVTDAIWGRAEFGHLFEAHLHPDAILRGPDHLLQGRLAIATAALQPMAAFPGRRLFTEDAGWTAIAGGTRAGALRLYSEGVHDGAGLYGPATGRAVGYRVLMDVAAKGAVIGEIWRLRDTAAIFTALGLDPERWAAERLAWGDRDSAPFRPGIDEPGAYTAAGNGSEWGRAWAALLERAMDGGFDLFDGQTDPAAEITLPGGVIRRGGAGARNFWLGLRAAFPSAQFKIRHRFGLETPLLPPRAFLRWSLDGRHDGPGLFGAPTGAEVHVMGMSQAEFGPGGLRREWTLIDPGAIWMQIKAQTG
ncbi:SnoaL-like polyketide cyclase [Roseivivax lentus]|uniref:SnoaL-like polyketide cyclase n=1 Tax=Roseivivax lentus TaxID=633194 RepID=A0A1N7L2V5_9RHOB|nr:SnoaL-like polyketide cyclase [Roseivivax lentus]